MPGPRSYQQAARQLAAYLASRQQSDGDLPGPDNYGVASSLWLWCHFKGEFAPQIERALRWLANHPPESHGEFNAYALLNCRDVLGGMAVDPLLRRVRFGGRHSANWTLLRAVCRAARGSRPSAVRARLEARAALARYMRRGFIADRGGVRSFAYHSFCGALLADLWRTTRWRWAAAAVARAAQFIAPFVLPNGDTLYVGRGQEQIFGYGALVYLLEAAAQITGEDQHRAQADRVFRYLLSFQRPDGSFPLVLNDDEPLDPWAPEPHPGWYSYSRYADYLPFLGGMLMRAASPGMQRLECSDGRQDLRIPHPDFDVHREARYAAVVSRPGGASTNDLAFPYICVDGVSLFPCYGAEEGVRPAAMPLPYGVLADGRPYSFRERLRYRLTNSGLVGESILVRHTRAFDFRSDGFTCRDEITFRRACSFPEFVSANFLFRNLRPAEDGSFGTSYRGARAVLRCDQEVAIHTDAAITVSGKLAALRSVREAMAVRPGQKASAELQVRLK